MEANFLFDLKDIVLEKFTKKEHKENELKIGDVSELEIIGRIHWLGYENDYIVCPKGFAHDKSTFKQRPESKLKKYHG